VLYQIDGTIVNIGSQICWVSLENTQPSTYLRLRCHINFEFILHHYSADTYEEAKVLLMYAVRPFGKRACGLASK
jgi:hypothetical protein